MAYFSLWRQFHEIYAVVEKEPAVPGGLQKGVSRANRYLVMYVLENHQDENLLGISVSKKSATAWFGIA